MPGKPFAAYGIEQQACIVADAYFIAEGAHVRGAPPLAVYAALIPFPPWTSVSPGARAGSGAGIGSGRSPAAS